MNVCSRKLKFKKLELIRCGVKGTHEYVIDNCVLKLQFFRIEILYLIFPNFITEYNNREHNNIIFYT